MQQIGQISPINWKSNKNHGSISEWLQYAMHQVIIALIYVMRILQDFQTHKIQKVTSVLKIYKFIKRGVLNI